MGIEGEWEALRVTHHHTCAYIIPLPHYSQHHPPTLLRAFLHHVYTQSSRYISVSEEFIHNGQSRLQQWIKHLSRAAILYYTILTVRADIQRKLLKACANYHISVSTSWCRLSRSDRSHSVEHLTIWTSQIDTGNFLLASIRSASFLAMHEVSTTVLLMPKV